MKKTIFTLLLSLLLQVSFSQGTTLTKGETVEYISNKLQEVNDTKFYSSRESSYFHYSRQNISLDGKKIRYTNKCVVQPSASQLKQTPSYYSGYEVFTPENIASIELVRTDENGMSEMLIRFDGKVVTDDVGYISSYTYFYFNNNVPQNFNRIKNALFHLKDLLKAEGDPFDN